MIEIYTNIFIGTDKECSFTPSFDLAIIHACKYPCHTKALNYKGSLPKTHPNYLIAEMDRNLFLNMVDMEKELHPSFTNPIMKSAMGFIGKFVNRKKILIHCNQGISRAPSIGLLYLARIKEIRNDSFQNALIDFKIKYPTYNPGKGISLYLQKNWSTIIK